MLTIFWHHLEYMAHLQKDILCLKNWPLFSQITHDKINYTSVPLLESIYESESMAKLLHAGECHNYQV